MFDDSDPRKALLTASASGTGRSCGPFSPPEIGHFTQEPPVETGEGWRAWMLCATNMVLRVVELDGSATFARYAHVDEYMVFSLEPSVRFTITTEAGDVDDHAGNHLFIVPPGTSTVRVRGKGTVTFLYTTRAADLVAQCPNAKASADANPVIPPFQAWPDPSQGFRLRAYDLEVPDQVGRFGRIFRCTTMMVNILPRFMAPRDTSKISPHHHATFEQISLTLDGDFEHFLRWPWTSNQAHWLEDMRIICSSPSATVLPPPAIHTTLWVSDESQIVDIFSPPRMDFSRRDGWVLNAADYPMAQTDIE
ncbi:hypothetical protein [Celeribacter baekdonensis]|uniref:hypothetical protein n=1 Tax=Celeribacter baekdonensis TaxID=875171 RepID=UPI003A91E804